MLVNVLKQIVNIFFQFSELTFRHVWVGVKGVDVLNQILCDLFEHGLHDVVHFLILEHLQQDFDWMLKLEVVIVLMLRLALPNASQ